MADHNVRAMIRIKLVDPGQLLPQSKGGIENGITGRISKDPELIMSADFRVGLKFIDCSHPGERNAMAGLVKLARERYGQLDVLVAEFTDCPICLPVVNAPL